MVPTDAIRILQEDWLSQKQGGASPQPHREPKGTDEVLDSLLRNYAAAQYQIVQYLSEHLSDCAKTVDGDLDQILILAVIGQRWIDHLCAKGDGRLTASRISDVTGLPRQTVRRKLLKMAERNWVHQVPDSSWQLKTDAEGRSWVGRDLVGLDRRGMERLARMLSALLPIVGSGQGPTEPADPKF